MARSDDGEWRDSYDRATGGRGLAHLLDDLLVCVMEDVFTTVERTLIGVGEAEQVRATRQAFQDAMQQEFRSEVERVTGRRVLAPEPGD